MVKREMVPWLVIRGIGHALAAEAEGWNCTACRSWTPNGKKVSYQEVKRRCRKCCAVLRKAALSE